MGLGSKKAKVVSRPSSDLPGDRFLVVTPATALERLCSELRRIFCRWHPFPFVCGRICAEVRHPRANRTELLVRSVESAESLLCSWHSCTVRSSSRRARRTSASTHHIPGTLRQTFATPSLAHICLVVRYLSHVGLRSSLSRACCSLSSTWWSTAMTPARLWPARVCHLSMARPEAVSRGTSGASRARARAVPHVSRISLQWRRRADAVRARGAPKARPRATSMGSPAVAVMQVTGTGVPVPWECECDAHSRRRVARQWGPALEAWGDKFFWGPPQFFLPSPCIHTVVQ